MITHVFRLSQLIYDSSIADCDNASILQFFLYKLYWHTFFYRVCDGMTKYGTGISVFFGSDIFISYCYVMRLCIIMITFWYLLLVILI